MHLLHTLKRAMILSSFLIMTGCAFLPGMSMQNPGAYNNNPPPDPITPTIVPITPTVISQVSRDLTPYHYQIGAGDTLSITAWSKSGVQVSLNGNDMSVLTPQPSTPTPAVSLTNPALKTTTTNTTVGSGGYFVNGDGNVFIPILGTVHLAGLTEDHANTLLEQKLAPYIKGPMVQTTVTSFASQQVFILGEINGGNTTVSGGMTTSSLMSLPITGTPMTLATAMAQAGGMNLSTANTRLVYIIRQSSLTHPVVYWLNMESPASMLYAENFPLTNNDIVYVSTAGLANFNRVLNQILPAVQTIWFTDSVIKGNN